MIDNNNIGPTNVIAVLLDFMPGSHMPVIRQPFAAGEDLPYWATGANVVDQHHLYDLGVDPAEQLTRLGLT